MVEARKQKRYDSVKHTHKTGSYNIYLEDIDFIHCLAKEEKTFISRSELVRTAIHHVYIIEMEKTLKKKGIREIGKNHIMIEGKVFRLNGKN